LVRWGERVTPLGESDAALPKPTKSALQMIQKQKGSLSYP
jgi:hypothetical protein